MPLISQLIRNIQASRVMDGEEHLHVQKGICAQKEQEQPSRSSNYSCR